MRERTPSQRPEQPSKITPGLLIHWTWVGLSVGGLSPTHSVEQILASSTTHSRSRSGNWAARLSSHSCSVIPSSPPALRHREHEPNRGFLRARARAAGSIGEQEEYERCTQFLKDSSPAAAQTWGRSDPPTGPGVCPLVRARPV